MQTKQPAAPARLSARSKKLWTSILSRCRLEDEHRVLLEESLHALDRAEAARERLRREGLTVEGSHGGLSVHPLVAVERDARSAVMRGFRLMGLDLYGDPAEQARDESGRFGARLKGSG